MFRRLVASLVVAGLAVAGCQKSGDLSQADNSPPKAKTPMTDAPSRADESRAAPVHDPAKHAAPHDAGQENARKIAVANLAPSKAATTQPTLNNVTGTVTFTQVGDKVEIVAEVRGLKPNSKHGFHIHEKGDLSAPDLTSAGGHFNPGGHPHGGPATSPVHEGDMGNLQSNAEGVATLRITLDNISVGTGQPNDVVGKAVIVHEKADDLKSQPTGDSGGRVAGGIIQLK
jgi:Cu-Zn family superoxide dismutase